MARKNNTTIVGEEPEEMTVFLVKFRGKSDTLQKGFDAISQAVATFGGTSSQQKVLRASSHPVAAAAANGTPAADESNENGEKELDETADVSVQRETTTGVKRKPPKFLGDFDLNGDGTKWMEYAAQKKPKKQYEQYLLAALWLTKYGGQEIFTPQHLFTCIRSAGWGNGHQDFTQPLRTLKRDKSFFDNPEGKWKLTTPGNEAAEAIAKRE